MNVSFNAESGSNECVDMLLRSFNCELGVERAEISFVVEYQVHRGP